MKDLLKSLGPFRWFLVICTAVLVGFSFVAIQWYDTIDTLQKTIIYVTGSLVPIFFFLILFDIMMNRIQMAEKTPEEKRRFKQYTWFELAVLLILALSWYPFFNSVLS
jgi:hypothetical protein